MSQAEHSQLIADLLEVAHAEFPGLTIESPEQIKVFGVSDDGAAVWWTLRAPHGAGLATPTDGGPRFLGFYSTGKDIVIDVISLRVTGPADVAPTDESDVDRLKFSGWRHSWDRLGALHQMGVRAVGRPILPGR
jgi:hypothetical protein